MEVYRIFDIHELHFCNQEVIHLAANDVKLKIYLNINVYNIKKIILFLAHLSQRLK